MKYKLMTTLAVLGLAFCLGSVANGRSAPETAVEVKIAPGIDQLQAVKSFSVLTRLHSWRPVDEDTLIIWATPFRPYLVELAYPSHDLRFSDAIGLTSVAGRVHAKFDSVKVRGFRYPIEAIYEMTRDEARNW